MEHTRFADSREDIALALEESTALLLRHLGEPRDLSLTSAVVLSRIGAEGPVRLTALAAGACVSQPSMTQLVQRLERGGLATRVSDPEDGRGTLVGITDDGRGVLADLRRARRSRLAELMTTLSAEDEATLTLAMHAARPVLQRLIDNAARRRVSGEAAGAGSLHRAPDQVLSDTRVSATDGEPSAAAQPTAVPCRRRY
jgi:DNA-binding MarR family transcriptional regulator